MPHRAVAAMLLATSFLFAQEFRATIQGTVQDPSQAVIAGAEVALRNVDTAVERKTTSDAAGHYLFQFLPPGNYTLTTRRRDSRPTCARESN